MPCLSSLPPPASVKQPTGPNRGETHPNDLQLLASQGMRSPENLTIFQEMLPVELLERELGDIWLKTPVFARSLARLQNARIVMAPIAELAELYG